MTETRLVQLGHSAQRTNGRGGETGTSQGHVAASFKGCGERVREPEQCPLSLETSGDREQLTIFPCV